VLAVAAVAGLLVGLHPAVTRALAAGTTTITSGDSTTFDTTTSETTTTEPETVTETQTTTTTVPATTSRKSTTATTAPASSSSSTPWGWIALGLALAAVAVIVFAIWQRRRVGAESWADQAADLNRRCLLALDDVLAQGSVVTGRVQALAGEAQALEARAPDDRSRVEAGRVRARLDELAATLESDRALRLSSPPPGQDQIAYSDSLIRQQAEQLEGVLRPARSGEPSQ
jgi:hypothetical protein